MNPVDEESAMKPSEVDTAEQLLDLRRANSARCAHVLRSTGPATIAEIAAATGLSRPTVTARLQDLARTGLVTEMSARAPQSAGRPAGRFAFMPDAGVVAGLELAKHVERLIFTNLLGKELWHGERPVVADDAQERLASASAWVTEIAKQLGKPLLRVGVAVPGSMDPTGVLVDAAAFTQWRGEVVPPIVSAAFAVPTDVRHDVAAAMLAEQRMGSAKEVETFVVPVLWHRVSAGIVVSGTLYGGSHGRAGSLFQRFDAATDAADDHEWASDPAVSEMVVAAEAGDRTASASLDRFVALAGEQIAMLQFVIDPEIIVLHGPLTRHRLLVERVGEWLQRTLPVVAPIVVSEFGQYGTVIGSVLTALDGAAEHLIGPGLPPHELDRTTLSHAIAGHAHVA